MMLSLVKDLKLLMLGTRDKPGGATVDAGYGLLSVGKLKYRRTAITITQ